MQVEKRASDEMTTAAGKLNQSITDLAFFQSELAQKYMNTALWQIGFATLACITLSLLIAWRMTRSITVPLRETLSSAQRIADGDLTAEITSSRSDELGELMTAMGAMNQSLRNIISRVRDGVNNSPAPPLRLQQVTPTSLHAQNSSRLPWWRRLPVWRN